MRLERILYRGTRAPSIAGIASRTVKASPRVEITMQDDGFIEIRHVGHKPELVPMSMIAAVTVMGAEVVPKPEPKPVPEPYAQAAVVGGVGFVSDVSLAPPTNKPVPEGEGEMVGNTPAPRTTKKKASKKTGRRG